MARYLAGFLFVAALGHAQFIIPVTTPPEGPVPGGHGSVWDVKLFVYNGADQLVRIGPCVDDVPILVPMLPPGATAQMTGSTAWQALPLIRCIKGTSQTEKVKLNLRVQDLSRQSQTWGTEIPVIDQSEMITTEVVLVNVPVREGFRQALRIYTWDGSRVWPFLLEVLAPDGRVIVAETLSVPASSDARHFPGYFQILDLPTAYPGVDAEEAVTVRIVPQGEGALFWAFVSVTNNETQHVTTITPQ